jgi:hypothetical protein
MKERNCGRKGKTYKFACQEVQKVLLIIGETLCVETMDGWVGGGWGGDNN